LDGGAPGSADSFNVWASENEMVSPTMPPRIEQNRYFSSQGIDTREVGTFAQVAAMTCQSEITFVIRAAVLLCHNVFYVVDQSALRFWQAAILTTPAGTYPNTFP
jgi:hypothetical protein